MAPSPILSAQDAQLLIDQADSGFVVTDHNAKIIYCNNSFARWTGQTPEALVDQRLSQLLDVPGKVFFDTHILPMILLQGYAREVLCRLRPDDAEHFPILINASRHPADDGPEARIVFNISDATERSMYEADLRHARDVAEELAAVIRSARVAIFRVTSAGKIKNFNPRAATMFGFDAADATGRAVIDLVPLNGETDWLGRVIPQALGAEAPEFFDGETPDGKHLSISLTPISEPGVRVHDPDYALLMRDITQRVQAERQLMITLQELNHRVKNNLAVVAGIARQTFRSKSSADETNRFMSRLQSMSKAHDLLVSNQWLSTSIREVTKLAAEDSGVAEQFDLDGPDVVFSPQSVSMLALALFELMTNSMKYGALTSAKGRVRLHWTLEAEGEGTRFTLVWEEQGGPRLEQKDRDAGFGSKLVKSLVASELDGTATMDFCPTGLVYRLEAPYKRP